MTITTDDDAMIRIDPVDADPGFTAFENLIICDLVNDNRYLDAVMAHEAPDATHSSSNAPSKTALNGPATKPEDLPDRRTRIQDVLDWHYTRPWHPDEPFTDPVTDKLFEGSDVPDTPAPPDSYQPGTLSSDDVEPTRNDIAYFLQALSCDVPATDPNLKLRQRQREMLAITADRFAGVLSIGTGRRIVQSLSMFVDFTVRKDKNRNVLMW